MDIFHEKYDQPNDKFVRNFSLKGVILKAINQLIRKIEFQPIFPLSESPLSGFNCICSPISFEGMYLEQVFVDAA